MNLMDIAKKLSVIRSAYKPIKLATSPYKPLPAGKIGKLKAAKMSGGGFSGSAIAGGAVGALGLFPIAPSVLSALKVSDFNAGAAGTVPAGQYTGRRPHDPYTDHDFQIEIGNKVVAAFEKFDGLSWECDIIEYKDGLDFHPHKRPGVHRFGNIKLTRGMTDNGYLWDWCKKIKRGSPDRRNGSIKVLNRTKDTESPVIEYQFFGAMPVKWSSFRGDGKGNATLIEEIELIVDRFKLKK